MSGLQTQGTQIILAAVSAATEEGFHRRRIEMDFEIPEEYKAMQQLAKRFLEEEIRPLEKQVEENEGLPRETAERLRKRSQELGLWAPFSPEE